MSYIATVSSKGQITLPKPIREMFGLSTGNKTRLEINKNNDEIVMTKVEDLDEVLTKMHEYTKKIAKKHHIKAGLTVSEMKEAYAKTEAGKRRLKEMAGLYD
ncbi:MAG: AbrB/MazE/SpoVT family DNA-binding domain-containing protein [Candidatus Nomurabacteria bacterium]|jgi:AbrB family looped-hinge helix DNA binding protein|nr:AbrB/MazE/SpoVT family DNA-binding domain-containing protein [Candidatus Nomurabacteria bacterium]